MISKLESLLAEHKFVVTCELGPPAGAALDPLKEKARMVRGYVDACNLTDCTTAMVRLSSLASSIAVMEEGIEPIMQLTLRDRNRIALQSDLLGASALGIRNILCLYGDPPSVGNEKDAKPVYDISTLQFISMLRKMRDEGVLLGGGKLSSRPVFFIGAAASPKGEESKARIEAIRAKIDAGAEFIQTQPVFDIDLFASFMDDMRSSGLTERCHFIAGIMPLRSAKMAKHVKSIPGIEMTEKIMERMERAGEQQREGVEIALELISEIKKMEGVSGIHIMTVAWEEVIAEIVRASGLAPAARRSLL